MSPTNESQGAGGVGSESKQRRGDRIYRFFNLALKSASDAVFDVITEVLMALGRIGGNTVLFTSSIYVFLVKREKPLRKYFFLNFAKSVVGVVFAVPLLATYLIAVLLGGAAASLLGLRNTAFYPRKEQAAAWSVFVLVALTMPFFVSDYTAFKVGEVMAYAVLIAGLDFLFGQCGILTLGQAAFALVGSYLTVHFYIGTFGFSVPYLVACLLAASSAAAMGVVFGLPSLRVKDTYLGVVTLALGLAIPKVIRSKLLENYSGLKEGGLAITQPLPPKFLSFVSANHWNYYLALFCFAVLMFFSYNILYRSQVGRAFRVIRCDVEIARIMGVKITFYKLLAFAMSAFYAGFAGGMLTLLIRFASPEGYTINDSLQYIVAIVLGGTCSIFGSVIGGTYVAFENDFARYVSTLVPGGKDLVRLAEGISIVIVASAFPRGLAGELSLYFRSRLKIPRSRGAYYMNPPPDYDYLERRKPKVKPAENLERTGQNAEP